MTRQRSIYLKTGYTCAQFDGASSAGGLNCGVGGFIIDHDSSRYRWLINCGEGSNTKAELLGAWTTLTLANHLKIQNIQVMGDSKVVIDWLKQKGNLHSTAIEGWKQRINELINSFQGIYFQHIYRDFNVEADLLSKQALSEPRGRLSYYVWDGGTTGPTFHINLF
jgi:ribonuclease HI